MVDIFALQGRGSLGKSSTLIELLALVVAKYPGATVQALHKGTKDIKVIVSPVSGKKIGIESRGDPNSRLKESLIDFRNARCAIVFCACRTGGMTVDWINGMVPPGKVQFIKQIGTNVGQHKANIATAAALMRLAGI